MQRLIVPVIVGLLMSLVYAGAQQPFKNHAIPIGRGAGQAGFNSVGPCNADVPLVGAGASTDPACHSSALGTMSSQAAGAVAITGGTLNGVTIGNTSTLNGTAVTNLAAPTLGGDATNKTYVDGVASGLHVQSPVVVATTGVLSNSPSYNNGASGVGATLTAGSNAVLTIDSVSPTINQRILVKDQASALQNGCYTLTTVGTVSVPYVLTRCTDFDAPGEMLVNSSFFISSGTSNGGGTWILTGTVATVGSTAANFSQFSGSQSYWTTTGGTNITNNNVGNVTVTDLLANTSMAFTKNQAAETSFTVNNSTGGGSSSIKLNGTSLLTRLYHMNDTFGAVETTTPIFNLDAKNSSGSIVLRTGTAPTARVTVTSTGAGSWSGVNGSFLGATSGLEIAADNSNPILRVTNINSGATQHALANISAGSSSGSAILSLTNGGVTNWYMAADRSQSSRFALSASGGAWVSGTGDVLRFTTAGVMTVPNLAGHGTGCVATDNTGTFTFGTCGTGLPALGTLGQVVANTGVSGTGSWYTPHCALASVYGALGDGVADNTSALISIFAALTANDIQCVAFPAGIFNVTTCASAASGNYTATLNANKRAAFYGAGIGQTTFVFACTTGTGGFTFTFTGTQTPYNGNAISVAGFSMKTTKAGAGAGTAIALNGNTSVGNASIPTTFRDINLINDGAATTGWDQGFVITDASQVHFDNVTGASCNNAGAPCYRGSFIKLVSTTAAAMTGIIIRHADAQFFNEGITASRTGSGRMEGLFISDTNLSFMNYGIDINIPGTDGQITGTQVNAVVGAITVTGMDGGSITGGTQICDPAPAVSGTGNCIYINAQRWAIQGANVAPALTLPNIKYNGVVFGPLAQLNTITGTKISNPDTGIWFQASSTLNKAFLNHVVNPQFAVGVNSGSSSYMSCNSADSSASGSSGACP